MGYSSNSPAYYIYSPVTNTLHESRSVQFDEHFTGDLKDLQDCYQDWRLGKRSKIPTGPFALSKPDFPGLHLCTTSDPNSANDGSSTSALLAQSGLTVTDPLTYNEAINSAESAEWLSAILAELQSHSALRTWTVTLLPAGRKAVGFKWIFKTKIGQSPTVTKKKARLVAKGYSQKYGVDFEETFAPTVGKATIRTVMSFAAAKGWELEQADVDTAFLNAELTEDIYMTVPEGVHLITNDDNLVPTETMLQESKRTGTKIVVKLNRALYGLKQAPRAWRQRLTAILSELNYLPSICDPGAYYKVECGQVSCILLVYVDDILIACPSKSIAQSFKHDLSRYVQIKYLQSCKHILGITVRRDQHGIYLSQSHVLQQLLCDHGMLDCRPASVPITATYMQEHQWSGGGKAATGSSTTATHQDKDQQDFSHNSMTAPTIHPTHSFYNSSSENLSPPAQSKFQSVLGTLLYVSTCTRPDLSFTVSVLCRKMQQATNKDMEALKHLLRYIKGTTSDELTLGKTVKGLTCYTDSSFADCRVTRRSSAGYLFQFMGGTVSWRSQLQKTVALSTAEAEYMGLTAAVQEGLFLRQLIQELGLSESSVVQENRNSVRQAVQQYDGNTVSNYDSYRSRYDRMQCAERKTQILAGVEPATPYNPITISMDNQAAIAIAGQSAPSARSKHIAVRHSYVQQLVESNDLILRYVPTSRQLADIFTKPLTADKFLPLKTKILSGSEILSLPPA